jgi:periplasmic protein TonB
VVLSVIKNIEQEKKMLEQFVESEKNVKNSSQRGKFLITTAMLVCTIFLNGILWSLFAADLGMANGDFELSSVVAPVAITENEPTPPEPIKKADKPEQTQKSDIPTRQDNIARIDEVQPIPEKVATQSNGLKSRPIGPFKISNAPESEGSSPTGNPVRGNETTGNGITNGNSTKIEDDNSKADVPPDKKKVVTEPVVKQPVKTTISRGVINGTAINLPKPIYPAAAKAIHAQGDVSVQVTIDENGNVISANAVSGHPLLKQVSEAAARGAKFKPTFLSDQPVKVTGVIVYKFTAQ